MQETWIQGSQGERFLLRRELGRGAMGLVVLADQAPQGRRVVLKILLAAPSGPQLERFSREGEVAARLQHPGIVPIHGVGRLSDGRPYLCFAHVEGARDLEREFLQAPLERRLEWLMEAGAALGHAHQQGIVHRDLKLSNLLVDGGGRVRVADFGVALLTDQERLTQSGALVGTVLTMAPEQATGKRGAVGPPSDVWSLGVLLYLACAERYPFEGSSQVEVLQQIVRGRPSALSGVPAALSEVVTRALQPEPQDRYADGAEFAEALELATLRGEAGSRGALPLALGALALTLAAGVGIGLALRPGPQNAPASPRPSAATSAPPSPTASRAVVTESPPNPAQLLAEAKALAETGRPGVRAAYTRAAEAGSLEAQEYLSVRGPRAERERWLRRAAEGGSASAAFGLAKRVTNAEPKRARALLLQAAEQGYRPAMVPLSRSYLDERGGPVEPASSERWLGEALRLGDPVALLEAGRIDYRQGRQAKGVARVRQAAEADLGAALIQLGRWQSKGWRNVPPNLDEAEATLRRALELEAKDAAGHLAIVLHDNGKARESERLLQERIQAGDRFAKAVWGRALFFYMGRREEGLRALHEAAAPRPPHPRIDYFFAKVLNVVGRRALALPLAESAVKAGVLEAKLLLAELLNRQGRAAEAERLLRVALAEGLPSSALALSAVTRDPEEKKHLLKRALELHDPSALVMISRQAAEAKLLDQCRLCLERATASGDASAHLLLANFFARGVFGKPEPELAGRHWLEAARRRRIEGAVGLAKWVQAHPESPHQSEAKYWLEEACRQRDPEALKLRKALGW